MNPAGPVQRQLDAYNAHDLGRFVAKYSDDIRVFKPPAAEAILPGKAAFTAHYANNRSNLPSFRAVVVSRMVVGDKVVDHERITDLQKDVVEALVVYQVVGEHIAAVWFY